MLLALAFTGTANAQNLGTCTVTDWHTGAIVTTPAAGEDLRVTCPGLFNGLTDLQLLTRLLVQFEKSGYQSRPFQFNRFQDQFGIRVPLGAIGATQMFIYKLGYGSYVVNFQPPVVTSAPVLLAVKSVFLDRLETSNAPQAANTIARVRIRYLITFRMDGVGSGGTFLFHFVKADGSEVVRVGKVFPRSSGLAEPEGQVDIYDDELDGVTGVYVTDPNDTSIPPSNTLPVEVALPSAT